MVPAHHPPSSFQKASLSLFTAVVGGPLGESRRISNSECLDLVSHINSRPVTRHASYFLRTSFVLDCRPPDQSVSFTPRGFPSFVFRFLLQSLLIPSRTPCLFTLNVPTTSWSSLLRVSTVRTSPSQVRCRVASMWT